MLRRTSASCKLGAALASALCLVVPALQAQSAAVQHTRFASRNAVEKICLTLEHQARWKDAASGRFQMASSNCTIDRDFEGSWRRVQGSDTGDTLVFNTDRRPHFKALALPPAKASEAAPFGKPELQLRSADPAMLRALRVRLDEGEWQLWKGPSMPLPQGTKRIRLLLPGMAIVELPLAAPVASSSKPLRYEVVFEDLHVPALVDDRWLLMGSTLQYLPREGSVRTESIELKKGKRCWYKP